MAPVSPRQILRSRGTLPDLFADRRRSRRAALRAAACFWECRPDEETLPFSVRDVSSGGAFLLSDLLWEVGDTFWLELELPDSPVAVRVRGRVIWVNREPSTFSGHPDPGMGIEFLDLGAIETSALDAYLA